MDTTRAQQKALDNKLVAPADSLKIGKSNLQLSPILNSKEPTLQVVLKTLKLTSFYKAFKITTDVPEIYLQEFWVTVSRHHSSLCFKMNGKSHTINVTNFRDMLQICPNLPGEIKVLSDVNVNHMHQPWRSFVAIINKCLSGKTTTLESLRLSRAQILWEARYYSTVLTLVVQKLSDDEDDNDVDDQSDDDEVNDDGDSQGDDDQDDDDAHTESDNDDDDFVHPNLSTHNDDDKMEDSFDPRVQTPSHVETIDEDYDEVTQGGNDEKEKLDEEEESDRHREEAQADNEEFINKLDENIKKIIKEKVKVQVKEKVSKILSRIEKFVNEQLEFEVLTRSSNEAKTSHDEDDDEEPSARSNRGSKRRRAGKEPESTSEPKEKTSKPTEHAPQEFDTGFTEDQPVERASQLPDWLQKQAKPPTPNHDWNKTLLADHRPIQPRISNLDWNTPEGWQYPHDLCKPLPLIPNSQGRCVIPFDHFIHNDLAYERGGASSRTYSTSVTKTKAADYRHVEDLQLGVKSYQKKLNLTRPNTYILDLKRLTTYSAYPNPRGFIYQNKDKKNRLMRIKELHKFSDGKLNDVQTVLYDILKRIKMKYLPQKYWKNVDKERAGAIIQAIVKQLKNRRIIRSLEKFIGGRPYEGDFQLLERTI
nr:hypothetical protein [Tanacetum cinerariifolium]